MCAQDEDFALNLYGDHKARVAAFVADLMDDDEDEAEIPMRAMRRPVVMAIAVQSECRASPAGGQQLGTDGGVSEV